MDRDVEQANRVIEHDDQIDLMEEEIDQFAIRLLATRQPMASDLRLIAMAMKISNDLERMGDYATNIAKRCERLAKEPPVKPLYTIPRMAQISQAMVKDVLDAYVERDTDKAIAVWRRDDEVDDLFTSLFRELLTYMMEDAHNISQCIDLIFVARIWSGSATTPPTSPRRSTTSSTAAHQSDAEFGEVTGHDAAHPGGRGRGRAAGAARVQP